MTLVIVKKFFITSEQTISFNHNGRKSTSRHLCLRYRLSLITNSGKIHGHHLTSYKGNKYEAYQGIPYALPPIGKRRFQASKTTSTSQNLNINYYSIYIATNTDRTMVNRSERNKIERMVSTKSQRYRFRGLSILERLCTDRDEKIKRKLASHIFHSRWDIDEWNCFNTMDVD